MTTNPNETRILTMHDDPENNAAQSLNALGFRTYRFAPTTDLDTPHNFVLLNIDRTTQIQLAYAPDDVCDNCEGTPAYEPRTHRDELDLTTCLHCLDPHGEFTFLAEVPTHEAN
jgi:hypothetical protein